MSDWHLKIDLTDVWNKPDEGKMTIQELAGIITKRLECLIIPIQWDNFIKQYLEDIIEEFIIISKDNDEDPEVVMQWFNLSMNDLYNWADIKLDKKWNGKKVCWVATRL